MIADAVNDLADVFIKDLDNVVDPIILARYRTQKFAYPEYIDVGDFATQLLSRFRTNSQVKEAATNIRKAIHSRTEGCFVIANTAWGRNVQRASGVSLYFPHEEKYAPDYADLLYSKQGHWRAFLEAFHAVTK